MSERLALMGGAYTARSLIANAQRCVNLYPEVNPKDAPVQMTHYQRPGLRALVQGPHSVVRGVFRASNGNGYCVIGQDVFSISTGWVLTKLGSLMAVLNTPISMVDNGVQILLVDNSPLGYTINLSDNTFAQVNDPTGFFNGATKVDYLDTFTIWNIPNTNAFGSTLSNGLTFDPLFFAGKTNWPDKIVSLAVVRREIYLIGELKSTVFYDSGGATFPFSELAGASFDHGCCAPFSLAQADIAAYWLGQDLQGSGVVFRGKGYKCERISNHALEYAIQKYPTITDAIGYTYQQGGHLFYVLQFPSANVTWVFDESTDVWHQRAWTDANGNLNRDRTNCATFLYGTNVVGDYANGTLYALDTNIFWDEVDGQRSPMSCIRGFPHLQTGVISVNGQDYPKLANGKLVDYKQFIADIQSGTGPQTAPDVTGNGKAAQIGLRWSDDRGYSWGNTVLQSAGKPGQFGQFPQWPTLGQARDRVFELSWSFAGQVGLNGAWVDAEVLGQ